MFLISANAITAYAQSEVSLLINEMLAAIDNTQTLRFKLKSWERIDQQLFYSESDICFKSSPFKVYIKQWEPDKGVEVLYVEGERSGNALIKPRGFPYVNVKLSPLGWRMRENQHHTIFESGFEYMATLTQAAIQFGGQRTDELVVLDSNIPVHGYSTSRLTINNYDYGWKTVTIQTAQSLHDFSHQHNVSTYQIIQKNAGLKLTDQLAVGTTLKVPNTYAKKVVLYIDNATKLPVKQEIYDEAGLFEKYEFLYLEVNPTFEQSEFTPDHAGYGF